MSSNCNNCNLDGGAISLQNSVRPDIVELIISDSEFDGNYMSSNGDNVYSRGSVLKADDRSLIQIINTIVIIQTVSLNIHHTTFNTS